jgi:predicted TIM-barrel fold metal-dependent hydrolase
VIDAHLHVVDVASVQVEAHLAPSGAWWERVDPAAEAVLKRVHTAGVERAVFVQAIAAHGYDCSYLLSNARPGVALVGAVDPFGPDPVAALDTLADAGIDGLRLFSIRSPRPWLAGDVGRALVARCVERRVRPSVCVLPGEISALVELASAFPDTEFAVDHVAFAADDEQLAVLAAQANLCPTVTATSPVSVDTAMRCFGTDRLSWGSDHPQHGAEYPTTVDLGAARRLWFGGSLDR